MNNKEIGFDVFENSDVNTIEEIGTEKMNIDKNSRDRMLKITMDKYAKNKKELGLTEKAAPEKEDYTDEVTSVEKYSRSKIHQFVYITACSAAAVALIAGSVFMLGHNKKNNKNVQDPLVEVTTSTAVTSETVTTTDAEIKSTETVSTTAIVTSTDITTASVAAETTAIVTETSETDLSDEFIYHNPHPDRTDITDEEIDAARIRVLDKIMNVGAYRFGGNTDAEENMPIWDIKYSLTDVNGDSIPELFIGYTYLEFQNTAKYCQKCMFIYDGNEYIPAHIKNHSYFEIGSIMGFNFQICPEENLICTYDNEGFPWAQIIKIEKDNTTETLFEVNDNGCFKNGKTITPDNYNPEVAFNEYETEFNKHNWKNIFYELIPYADKNEAAIKYEEENGPVE